LRISQYHKPFLSATVVYVYDSTSMTLNTYVAVPTSNSNMILNSNHAG